MPGVRCQGTAQYFASPGTNEERLNKSSRSNKHLCSERVMQCPASKRFVTMVSEYSSWVVLVEWGPRPAQTVAACGAEVVVLDYAPVAYPVAQAIQVDLQDRQALDKALDEVAGPIHAVFSAAGIAGGPGLMKVNFIAHRHLIERLIDEGKMGSGVSHLHDLLCRGARMAGAAPDADRFLGDSATTSRPTLGLRSMKARTITCSASR